MSYVAPEIKDKFDSLSEGLKAMILEKDVQLNTVFDLINVLELIVEEDEEVDN
ncbi:MAG TPA: hypothetical protein GXZ90_00275 [Clostridiales bacterium]|nr:hypothetical protein [Clostridiales bacterium]